MVVRQASLPYPAVPTTAPPPPPPPPPLQPSGPGLTVETNSVSPMAGNAHKPLTESPFGDMGNPWHNSRATSPISNRDGLPEALQVGLPRTTSPQPSPVGSSVYAEDNDVHKQATPRSSIDSLRSRESKDFWESSDEEEERHRTASTTKDIRQEGGKFGPPAPIQSQSLELPSSLQIKRKAVASSPVQEHPPSDAGSVPPSFASNNPFRRPSSSDPAAEDTTNLLADDTDEKGTAVNNDVNTSLTKLGDLSLQDAKQASRSPSPAAPKPWDVVSQRTQPLPSAPLPPHPLPRIVPPLPPMPAPTSPLPAQPRLEIHSPSGEQPPLISIAGEPPQTFNPWTSQTSLIQARSPLPDQSTSMESLLDREVDAERPDNMPVELEARSTQAPGATGQIALITGPSLIDLQSKSPISNPAAEGISRHPVKRVAPPPGPLPDYLEKNARKADEEDRFFDASTGIFAAAKATRSTMVTRQPTEQELAQWKEWRNETYQIKHFDWYDHRSNRLRRSSMLVQNKNGPCPLLALVNALILGSDDASQQDTLDAALQSREQVSLGLIIETLMDELLSGPPTGGELPDVDELNRFLMKLRTGMNMNPRFVPQLRPAPNLMDVRNSMLHLPVPEEPQVQAGTFEPTEDLKLYSAFQVPTVHGWLPRAGSQAASAFQRSAPSYEDAQVKQFGEEELEYKLTHDGLSDTEQDLWQDIMAMKEFLQSHPTQLTDYGLDCIKWSMRSGSFAILFRNDHFSTIYKQPHNNNIYSLVTDAGYADSDDVIWETLVDVTGRQNEFCSGDFQSVTPLNHSQSRAPHQDLNRPSGDSLAETPLSPQEWQEQHDADFAMALQLQEEEEQDQRRRQSQSQSQSQSQPSQQQQSGTVTAPAGGSPLPGSDQRPRRQGQGIPISLRDDRPADRPLFPPRNGRAGMPAVNRSSELTETDAPPAYEEAARGRPYNPPLGSPLHPTSSPAPEGAVYDAGSSMDLSAAPAGRGSAPPLQGRRNSAYTENSERRGRGLPNAANRAQQGNGRFEMGMSPAYELTDPGRGSGRMPGSYIHTGRGGHGASLGYGGPSMQGGAGPSSRERDCVVM